MLVALIHGQPGALRAAASALLTIWALFAVGLFGGQLAAPDKFGCTFFGEDFVTLYAASRLVVSGRGAGVYDVALLTEAQDQVLAEANSTCNFKAIMAYGLLFLVPFLPLTVFPAQLAYYLWTGLTVAIFFFGAWRTARAVGVAPWPFWLIILGFFPVVGGLLQGQVHGLQFLALVEFWLAQRRQAERSAGLWLSLQLVKPQFLPLLVIWALWQRRWRLVGWCAGGGLTWLGLTVWLAGGMEGVANYVRMIRQNVAGLDAHIGVPNMINWRAFVAEYVGDDRLFSVGVIGILTLLTVCLVLWSWRRRPGDAAGLEPRQFLVLVSGTLLIGYDTHAYSLALLLAPAFLFLANLNGASRLDTRWWMAVVDFTLLAPMLLVCLAFTLGSSLPLGPRDAMLLSLVAVLGCGVFLPSQGTTRHRALVER